ncbi:MAG: hypothetical protein AMJ91_05080 [candidate division Zixibacteria bacterium SM23_73_3]|nr:MAG: hypothetical protein AMJ91_05080 [candidate division Zixibacteria bacterium SM23_73_3]
MEKILGDIRSVPGVTGAMVLAKESLNSYHLLPASFTARSIKEVGRKLLKLSERLPPHSRLNLKFENGVGLVYNLEKSVVLIFGRSNLEFSLLRLVLKSALQSIERKLEKEVPLPEKISESTFVIDKANLNLLIEAINLVAQGYVKDKGIFWVTKNLRKTKEDVIKEFPQISSFYVDNDGRVSVLDVPKEMFNQKMPLALVKWIDFFVKRVPHPTPGDRVVDIRELTARISKPLDGIGFYDLYKQVAKKLV